MNKIVSCPHCGDKNDVEIDMMGIENGEPYRSIEECAACLLPFVVEVQAKLMWHIGKVEWEDG